ncbi:hypothetical protein, partial [uncultured Alistipes sp.]
RSKRSMIMPRRSIFDEVKDRKHIGLFRLSDGFYLRLVRSLPFRGLAEAVAATEKRTAMRQSVFAKRLYVYGFIRNTYI